MSRQRPTTREWGEGVDESVLITGGAGFIGSYLADELLAHGYRVRALDALVPQVHGSGRRRPDYLDPEVELVVGDVRDPDVVARSLRGVDAVVHCAAAVGVGQSMYEIAAYTGANNLGTAVLLEALLRSPVSRLVVLSSMSIYGEGLYRSADGALRQDVTRSPEDLRQGVWEPLDEGGAPLEPLPTPETKAPALTSVYALSKYDQERMSLLVGGAYDIPTVALRLFNVYGPRQALSNPYTGVLAIFAARLLNGHSPLVYEDGEQRRDLVSVHDVARAVRLALETPEVGGVVNVGSGVCHTVRSLGERLAAALGRPDLAPTITRHYRVGDVRHCYADISRARAALGYEPRVTLDEGLAELADWLQRQTAEDHVGQAQAELAARGLQWGEVSPR